MRHQISQALTLCILTVVATTPATATPNPVPPQKPADQALANKLLGSITGGSFVSVPCAVIPPGDNYTEQHKGCIFAGDGGPVTDGLQLYLQPQKPAFSAEEPVMVDVQLRDGRKTDLSFEEFGPPLRAVNVVVKNEQGQDVPLAAFGRHLYEKQPFLLGHAVYVPSEMCATYHFWLNRVFDMSLPGIYTVTIRKTLGNDGRTDSTKLVSNTVSITVVEPNYQSPYYSEAEPDQPPHKTSPPAWDSFKYHF